MLKLLFNILLLGIVTQIECKIVRKGPLSDNNIEQDKSWRGLWFPHPPNYHYDVEKKNVNVAENESGNKDSSNGWHGLWFPHPPNKTTDKARVHIDFINKQDCDDGVSNIGIDFDPEDKRHSYNYLCLAKNRTEYEPKFNTTAVLMEHLVPAAYRPPVRCLNEKIIYDDLLPTFGSYRPLAPKFGTYKYLPPQRWLRSLSDGAIVFLYHPCAFSGQIKQLENILQGCLYRHVITPSQLLTPQRPLALLAWGKCLQMSVIDDKTVVKFIKDNAKLGLMGKQDKLKLSSHLYEAGLMTEAHLVTDEQDSEICGYKEM